ncbi:hypothetical protein AHMF7605_10420 [Adhaeribacter arboris]|uniref:Uncharacterized protein n=1 Tax=Adhaeribacter arboris TaxID=2072846 RepID=A0A2T2YEF8_9BACT|nr:hypothetical protein AHMF7605_10420 [Adhaeribacter arboris]
MDQLDNTSDLNKPISTATKTELDKKQDAVVSNFLDLPAPVANVITLVYDPLKPYGYVELNGNNLTIQLDDLEEGEPGVGIKVKKVVGTEAVTFKNGTTTIAPPATPTPSTGANSWDLWFVEKFKSLFFIDLKPFGTPTPPPAPVTKLPNVTGFGLQQTGPHQVTISYNNYATSSGISGCTLQIIRPTSATGTAPTVDSSTNLANPKVDNGPVVGNANATLDTGKTYIYRMRATKSGYTSSDWVTQSITII